MVKLAQIEHTQAFLDAQLRNPGGPVYSRDPLPFITVSREAGSGGSLVALTLARRLNELRDVDAPEWAVFDRNLVETLLAEKQLPPRLARFLPEDRVSELTSLVGELVGLHPSLWTLQTETNAFIRRLAQAGHVILVGRGAVYATAGLAGGVHVRTVGSHLGRAERTATAQGLSVPTALVQNRRADHAARKYVRALFDADVDDPHTYDFVVNTDRLAPRAAADHVVALVQSHRARLSGKCAPAAAFSAA